MRSIYALYGTSDDERRPPGPGAVVRLHRSS
jgi:hypothetical protein